MVLEPSFVSQKSDGRCAFEEVVLVCWKGGCFLNDRFRGATDKRAVILRAWNVSGNDEKCGRKAKAIHDRNSYSKLVNRSIIISERDGSALAILPSCDFRFADLTDGQVWRNDGPDHRQPTDCSVHSSSSACRRLPRC